MARAINALGFHSLARRTKGVLTAPVRAIRRAFAYAMRAMTIAWWIAHVDMSLDVTTYTFSRYPRQWGNSKKKRVYRRAGEALLPDCTAQTAKHTTGNRGVKVLGGLAWGAGECTLALPFDTRWNSANFISMVPRVEAALWEAYPQGPRPGPPANGYFLVLVDNDSVFQCEASIQALAARRIRVATFNGRRWPAQMQDCHIIENFFAECKRRLANSNPAGLETRAQFTTRVVHVMKNMNYSYIRSLVESMPRRMQGVIDNSGGITKY